jgi:hypothetical protein
MQHTFLSVALILFSCLSFAQPNFENLKRALKEEKRFNEKIFATLKTCVNTADTFAREEAIGGVSLSTKPVDVEKVAKCKLGKSGTGMNESNAETTLKFSDCDLNIEHDGKDLSVIAIGKDSKLKTKAGVGIGDTLESVKAKYKTLEQFTDADGMISPSPKSCDIPKDCLFDYADFIILLNKTSKKVSEIRINRFTNGYCHYD